MSDLNLSPQEQNIVDYHNGSMSSGRVGRDDQGRPMTVYSTGIMVERGPHKGKFVSVPGWVPSVNPDRPLTEGEAFDHWETEINEGKWPFYDSGTALNSRSQEIHTIMDNDLIHINEKESKVLDGLNRGTMGNQIPTIKGEEGHFKAYDHRQLMTHLPNKMGPGAERAGPMGTSGMHYVDENGKIGTGMRGEKTPAHISKNQDTKETFLASEMARNSMEQLRASLPRNVQDNLRGDMLLELADDGKYSLLVGDEDSGYVELSYGPDDYQDALSDIKRAYNYAAHTGDANMDAGFLGRASSAYRYNGYSEAVLRKSAEGRLSEINSNPFATEMDVLDALEEMDAMNDEVTRQKGSDKSKELSFSRRALNREARMRAAKMMR